MNEKLLGVVLAGGLSTRMGRDKAMLPHPAGGTYLTQAIERLKTVCHEVAVSAAAPLADRFTLVDAFPAGGPSVGIATALQYAAANRYNACVFTPIDTPALQSEDLQCLITAWRSHLGIVLATSSQLEPLIGVYSVGVAPEIQTLAQSDRRSLTRYFQSQSPPKHQTVSLTPEHCRNVNRPEDLIE